MPRTIINYMVFALLSSLCGVVMGMEKEHRTISFGIRNLDSAGEQQRCLQKLKKGKISVLALNNYVMNVSTAYQALKKEASFEQDILFGMICGANRRMRAAHEKEGIIYRILDAKTRKRMEGQDPCFRWAEIEYQNQLGPHSVNKVSAALKMGVLGYEISTERFAPFNYFTYQRALQDCDISKQKKLFNLLKNKTVYIELCSSGEISDWIKVTNNYKPVIYVDTARSPSRLLQSYLEDSTFHAEDFECNSTEPLILRIVFYVVDTVIELIESFSGRLLS